MHMLIEESIEGLTIDQMEQCRNEIDQKEKAGETITEKEQGLRNKINDILEDRESILHKAELELTRDEALYAAPQPEYSSPEISNWQAPSASEIQADLERDEWFQHNGIGEKPLAQKPQAVAIDYSIQFADWYRLNKPL